MTRWDWWLPLSATVVAAGLTLVGILAADTLCKRRGLALDGTVLSLAQEVESELRRPGAAKAPALVLERTIREWPDVLAGLALVSPAGQVEAQAGTVEGSLVREIELDLPQGRRLLRCAVLDQAARPAMIEGILVPSAGASGLLLIGLAALSGRLLVQRRRASA